MKQAQTLKVVRQLKIESSRIASIVTEKIESKSYIVTNKNGASITLTSHYMTKELMAFLTGSGCTIEPRTSERLRGRRELAGVKVKVLPIAHDQHYSKGALIQISAQDELSYADANRVRNYLVGKGVDLVKECTLVDEHRRAGSCEALFGRKKGRS